jgi:hypothetical protein
METNNILSSVQGMYTEQQAKCAEHNREVIWLVITTFVSAIFGNGCTEHISFAIAIFVTAVILRLVDTARYIYSYRKYQQVEDMIFNDKNEYKAAQEANKATLTSRKIFNIQMAFYWIILVEFAIYCILCVCNNAS